MDILERNAEGVVNVSSETAEDFISFQVPQNMSALTFLSNEKINDGDVFADDYWVYNQNKRIRKWFSRIPNSEIRFWHPKTDDVVLLESKRWKLCQHYYQTITSLREEIKNRFADIQEVHGSTEENGRIIRGKITKDEKYGLLFEQFIKEVNPNLVNQELYLLHQNYFDRMTQLGGRFDIAHKIFHFAICRNYRDFFIPKNYHESGYEKTLHMVINGRTYIFKKSQCEFGPICEAVVLPERCEFIVLPEKRKK